MMTLMRTLGKSGVQVSALGLGCWAIGGPFWNEHGQPVGWGQVNDDESIRAIHRALELGVTFFDTANVYGCGHSERVLARALGARRADVVIATKFGRVFDEQTRRISGNNVSPEHVREACEASLRRLNTDTIDLYQFHIGDCDPVQGAAVRDALEMLVAEGKLRGYAWSTDDPARARVFAQGPHCLAVQHRENIFEDNAVMLALCEECNLASVNRGPLAQGILTGKFSAETTFPPDDLRGRWDLRGGKQAGDLHKLESLRGILTSDGRTLAQAALGWLWARSAKTLPIPGFKTVQQVEDNAGALRFGPLSSEQMAQINTLLGR